MPFIRRNPSRRWLQNRPTLPLTSFGRSLRTEVYYNDFYGGDYYQNIQEESYAQQASTITGRTLSDLGISPGIETFEPISFINLDEQISLSPGKTLYFYLDRVVKGSRPLRYYLLKHPDWIRLDITKDGQVVTGTAPLTSAHVVDISVLVENNMGRGVLDFNITLEGFILTDSLGNILRDELSQVVESHIFDIVDEPIPERPPIVESIEDLEIEFEEVDIDTFTTIAEFNVRSHATGVSQEREEEVAFAAESGIIPQLFVDPVDPDTIQFDNDTLTWIPSRNFLRDTFIVNIKSAAPNQGLYPGNEDNVNAAEVEEELILISPNEELIAGNPDETQYYVADQFNTPTCVALSSGASLLAEGITDNPYQVVIDATLVVDENGDALNDPTVLDNDGNALYRVELVGEALEYYNENGMDSTLLENLELWNIHHSRTDENGFLYAPERLGWNTEFDPRVTEDGNRDVSRTYIDVLNENYPDINIETHIFSDISTIIKHLNAGNTVMTVIDSQVLWSDDYLETAFSGQQDPFGDLEGGHALLITGIVRNEDDDFEVILGNSWSGGESVRIGIEEFITASALFDFTIMSVGNAVGKSSEELALEAESAEIKTSWKLGIFEQIKLHNKYDTPEEAEADGFTMIPIDSIIDDANNIYSIADDDTAVGILTTMMSFNPQALRNFPNTVEFLEEQQSVRPLEVSDYFDRIDEVRGQELLGIGFTQEEIDELMELQVEAGDIIPGYFEV